HRSSIAPASVMSTRRATTRSSPHASPSSVSAAKKYLLRALSFVCRSTLALFDVLAISALMQVGLALPMLWYFHRATVMALPANLLAVTLTEFLMPAVALAVSLSYVSLLPAKIPALAAGLALGGITGTVRWIGGLRFADLRISLCSLC